MRLRLGLLAALLLVPLPAFAGTVSGVSGTLDVTVVGAALAAGSVNNGVTDSTTTRVTISSDSTGQVKLATGTSLVGKVGIDQTTPGTTNGVAQPDVASTGNTINSATPSAAYTLSLANGEGVASFSVTGLTASGATLTIEASDDGGTTWAAASGVTPATGALFTTLTTDQQFRVNAGGRGKVRLRVSSTGTGTITVASIAASVSSLVALSTPVPNFPATADTNNGAPGASTLRMTQASATYASSAALAANQVLKASAGTLYGLNVIADSTLDAATWFVMVYDATSAPVDGAVTPAKCFQVAASQPMFTAAWSAGGVALATGITVGVSTTGCFTKTASTHAFISGDFR